MALHSSKVHAFDAAFPEISKLSGYFALVLQTFLETSHFYSDPTFLENFEQFGQRRSASESRLVSTLWSLRAPESNQETWQ